MDPNLFRPFIVQCVGIMMPIPLYHNMVTSIKNGWVQYVQPAPVEPTTKTTKPTHTKERCIDAPKTPNAAVANAATKRFAHPQINRGWETHKSPIQTYNTKPQQTIQK